MLDDIQGSKYGKVQIIGSSESEIRATLLPYFDVQFYFDRYRDIDRRCVDALEHYYIFGWKEGRDPCDWFSTRRYIARYGDVAESGVNPFLHYLVCGKEEGRTIWPADHQGAFDLDLDPTATFVPDTSLRDLIAFPPHTSRPPHGPLRSDCLKLHWVIPDFSNGSGGHMTIFRIIRWMEIFGHDCCIWITSPGQHRDKDAAYDDIAKHFQAIRAPVAFADDGLSQAKGDAVIATGWQTVARVLSAGGFRERFYLVQDYEPSFHPMGSHSLAATWTYTQDLACICAGPWLAQSLGERYGRWTRHFWLAYDPSVYFPTILHDRKTPLDLKDRGLFKVPRIALYTRRATARRAVELAFLALEHLAAKGVRFHVDLFGEDIVETRSPFPCSSHGILSAEGLAGLYRKADLGICLSSTNYSLIPQEMMACGLPVVEIDSESTRAVFPKDVITLTGPHPSTIANDVEALLSDPQRRRQQAEAALRWVKQFDWENSARLVERALLEKLQAPDHKGGAHVRGAKSGRVGHQRRSRAKSLFCATRPIKTSVCIPTYNGGKLLAEVVERVGSQRAPWPFEIVIVDSSSTDGSTERLVSLASPRGSSIKVGLRLQQIAKADFQHGRTRNLCARLAHGEFVAFLTQDALPADEFWLYNLVTSLERFPKAAGAFGRHLPWPTATPFTKRDISNHFDGLLQHPLVLSHSGGKSLSDIDPAWRQTLHYFSDNNSCLRKSAWERVPYPEIDYGEDQAWAEKIIHLGYEKVYAPAATVYHSHEYTLAEVAERAETEAFFFARTFGYEIYNFRLTFQEQLASVDNADLRWARENGISQDDLVRRLAENKARLYGYAKGMERAGWRAPSLSRVNAT